MVPAVPRLRMRSGIALFPVHDRLQEELASVSVFNLDTHDGRLVDGVRNLTFLLWIVEVCKGPAHLKVLHRDIRGRPVACMPMPGSRNGLHLLGPQALNGQGRSYADAERNSCNHPAISHNAPRARLWVIYRLIEHRSKGCIDGVS